MADPVASVEKIVKIGLKIKEAVDTVRQNEEVCLEIRKSVLRYSTMLSQLQQRGVMNNSPVMSGALEDLSETLEHALKLVTSCQEKGKISRFVSAGDLSKQLRRVKDNISEKVIAVLFALQVYNTIVLLTMQDVNNPLFRQPEDTIVAETSFNRDSTDDARSKWYGEGNNRLSGSELPSVHSVELKKFSLSELKAGMDDENIIGRGAFGTIFKAVLKDRNVVTVKIFCDMPSLFPLPVYNHISKLQHNSIVKILGYCYEYEYQPYIVRLLKHKNNDRVIEKIYLVEEFVPNGSLFNMIADGSKLVWSSLFRIIEGVAQALNYLHEQHIVHLDVKPSNILLDSDMNPKITDFDISVILDAEESTKTYGALGTVGFIAPEMISESITSTKNDVYAFGITLLATVSCMCRSKPPFFYSSWSGSPERPRYPGYNWDIILKLARVAWQAGRVEELFDPSLFDCSQLMEIKSCIDVGLLCIQNHREDRPTMADVLEMLNGKAELPTPKKSWLIEWYEEPASPSVLSDGSLNPDDMAL